MRLRYFPTLFAAALQPCWSNSRDTCFRLVSIFSLRVSGLLLGITVSLPALPLGTPPNIVIIMPDDLSWDDFSYFNPAGAQTPAIDALARTSVRLTDFHVSPTCSPTRASLLTGRYNNATGVWHTILGRYFLRTDEVTLPDVLKLVGYRNAVFGKWHLGDSYPFRPRDRGFDHSVLFRGGGADQQHNVWGNRNLPPAVAFVDDLPTALPEKNASGIPTYSTAYFTSHAIAFMEEQVALRQPFFAYLAYNVAHLPHDRPPTGRPGISDQQAVVEHLDQQIGRVLAFLKSAGIEESTVVIFLTDNGNISSRFRAGKASSYEGGHRVPCFIRWPAGGVGGSVSSSREMPSLSSHIDLLPTVAEWTGASDRLAHRAASLALHGHSLSPLLLSVPATEPRVDSDRVLVVDNQRLDTLQKYRQASVMKDVADVRGALMHKWRLVSGPNGQPWELFDVLADPKQSQPLPHQDHPDIVDELKAAYEQWWTTVTVNSETPVRPILGTAQEPTACLYAHDWHTDGHYPPWNQTMVANSVPSNGVHTVELGRSGTFHFDLRRWPRELADETSLSSRLRHPILSAQDNQPLLGTALPIHSARLKIWRDETIVFDQTQTADSRADGVIFSPTNLNPGPLSLQTWFYDAQGNELCGAYYVYVE